MSIERFKPLLLQLLDISHKLVVGPNTKTSEFAEVLEGTFRRDYVVVLAILKLSEDQDGNRSVFGEVCMGLTRRLIEDVVSIEYILLKGKKEMAKKFKAFRGIELKRDLEYLRSAGIPPSEKTSKTIEDCYGKAVNLFGGRNDPQFWNHRRLWAGVGTRKMILELTDAGLLSDLEQISTIHMYGTTSGRLHFSPSGVLDYIYEDLFDNSNKHNLDLCIFVATSALSKLAMRFVNEIKTDEETHKAVLNIWRETTRLEPPQAPGA